MLAEEIADDLRSALGETEDILGDLGKNVLVSVARVGREESGRKPFFVAAISCYPPQFIPSGELTNGF